MEILNLKSPRWTLALHPTFMREWLRERTNGSFIAQGSSFGIVILENNLTEISRVSDDGVLNRISRANPYSTHKSYEISLR